jgi:hypothetical protein
MFWNCNINSFNFEKNYVTWQGTSVKLPDDDTEMSKHVAVYGSFATRVSQLKIWHF